MFSIFLKLKTAAALVLTCFAITLLAAAPAFALDLCPADLDDDGVVGSTDLSTLLGLYGTSGPTADFNRDGEVGCFDLEYLLGNFGYCPTCAGDVDGDGVVDSVDLNIVLGAWGNDCRVDLDQDGNVDADDVDALLCLWGTKGPLGDFDGNDAVDVADLNFLLASVGLDCRGDQNNDGAIDVTDLNLVLGNWGRCP